LAKGWLCRVLQASAANTLATISKSAAQPTWTNTTRQLSLAERIGQLNDIGHNRAGGMNSRESDDSFLDIDNDQGGFWVECGDWHGRTKFAIWFPSIIQYAGNESWRAIGTDR
jgi:hypothetical protein